jgi:CBS domain-containing protein
MLCEQIMKRDIECVSPTDTVADAARRMRDEVVGFLPVCDESREVLGTITDRDIVIRAIAESLPSTTPVEDVMSGEIVSCSPRDDVGVALELMAENRKSRIMCLDEDGQLAGVISLSDIAQLEEAGEATETLRQISQREVRN